MQGKGVLVSVYLAIIIAFLGTIFSYSRDYTDWQLFVIWIKVFCVSFLILVVVSFVAAVSLDDYRRQVAEIARQDDDSARREKLVERYKEYIANAENEERFQKSTFKQHGIRVPNNLVNTIRESKEAAKYWRAEAEKVRSEILNHE